MQCEEYCDRRQRAATLQRIGPLDATDVIGGVQAWKAAGLPVQPLRTTGARRAVDCRCGQQLEADDDEQLFVAEREHLARDHPGLELSDEQIREHVAGEARDVA